MHLCASSKCTAKSDAELTEGVAMNEQYSQVIKEEKVVIKFLPLLLCMCVY